MAVRTLARGIGTFCKDCAHLEARWSKCPHEYKIRYRSAAGKQTEEAGFATWDKAITRLTEIYNEKKGALRCQSKAERIHRYGTMRHRSTTLRGPSARPSNNSAGCARRGTTPHADGRPDERLRPA